MASKRRLRRKCAHKRKYTEDDAYEQAKKLMGRQLEYGRIGPYHCPFCHAWHVGHRPAFIMKEMEIGG
jgi:hypothetical protein